MQDGGDDVLRRGNGIAAWRIAESDALLLQIGLINMIRTNRGRTDKANGAMIQQLLIDPGHGPDQEHLCITQLLRAQVTSVH